MKRPALTLLELLVSIAIVAVLVGLLLPAVQKVREASARAKCLSNLRQYGLASQSFEAQTGRLPTLGGPCGYGWTINLAPHLDRMNDAEPGPLRCPSRDHTDSRRSDYGAADHRLRGFVAWDGPHDGAFGVRAADIRDGLSTTLAFAEVWTAPGEMAPLCGNPIGTPPRRVSRHARTTAVPPRPDGPGVSTDHFAFGGPHPGGVLCGFGDGSARSVSFHVLPSLWRAYGTRSGGEVCPTE